MSLPIPRRGWIRRNVLVVLAAVVLVPAVAGFVTWRYALGEWAAANQAIEDGKPDVALKHLKVCDAVWPLSPDVQWLGARAARLTNDYDTAENRLNRCRQLEGPPTRERVQIEFLLIRMQGGEVDDLGAALGKIVQGGHPDSPAILETMALAFIRHHRYVPAFDALHAWIKLRPDCARAYVQKGWVLERLNHAESAMEAYQRALEIDPNDQAALLRVAEMYLEDKKPGEALPYLQRLSALLPDDQRVKSRLGISHFHEGNLAEARRLLEGALPALPNDPVVLVALARLDKEEGKYDAAEARLKQILAADPSDTEAHFVLGDVYRLQGRDAEAEEQLALHKQHQERLKKVNEKLEKLVEGDKGTADDFADIAEQFLMLNMGKVGVPYADKALKKNRTHQRAHRLLADYFSKTGDADGAAYHRSFLRDDQKK